ncbi:MAG: DUF6544 family protein [Rhodospirillaceae bacterium]
MNMIADPFKLENVPAPVARYLRRVLRDRHLFIGHVELQQSGMLRADLKRQNWMPFTARHTVTPPRTEFVWEARVTPFPLVHLNVRDAYAAGEGSSEVSLYGLYTFESQKGGEPVNAGSLHRYLAEAVWYPTALLPSETLIWTPIDDTKALATLTHGEITVSLEFRFNPSGAVSSIYTPGRWGSFPGGYEEVPWEGRFHDYRLQGGIIAPSWAEVGWYLNDTWTCVWTGRIDSARYDFVF